MDLNEKQKRLIQLIQEIKSVKRVSFISLVLYLGYNKKQVSSFYKCAQGLSFPKFINSNIDKILEKLQKVSGDPGLIYSVRKPTSLLDFVNTSQDLLPESILVWVPFDIKLQVTDYFGDLAPLSIIHKRQKKGIILFKNSTNYIADGELYVDQLGMTTDIQPGMKIAIRRIDKRLWLPDRFYVIVDASDQVLIYELVQGDDEDSVRFVSTKAPDGPHKLVPLKRIEVLFSIVNGNFIPIPKRNRPQDEKRPPNNGQANPDDIS